MQFWDREYCADVVVFPESTEHVSKIMAYANENIIPVTPRGLVLGFQEVLFLLMVG